MRSQAPDSRLQAGFPVAYRLLSGIPSGILVAYLVAYIMAYPKYIVFVEKYALCVLKKNC